jgi:ribosome biogenesis GTPase
MGTASLADGFVFKAVRGLWYVQTAEGILCCSARGKLRSEHSTPLVGDRVEVRPLGNGKGSLEEIRPRKNSFVRPAVANLDVLVILASAVIPVTEPFLIDRMIAIAELKDCRPIVCFHKCDLAKAPELVNIYRAAGIDCLETSSVTGEGIMELQELLERSFCAFTGNSGVGKSSLLNALAPALLLPTGEVSQKLGRGRHTTRHVEAFRLGRDILAADTPGFSAFDAEDVSLQMKESLPELFREFRPFLGKCRFHDCGHGRDEGCAVRRAVEEGQISESRYRSYLRLREELKDLKEWNFRN